MNLEEEITHYMAGLRDTSVAFPEATSHNPDDRASNHFYDSLLEPGSMMGDTVHLNENPMNDTSLNTRATSPTTVFGSHSSAMHSSSVISFFSRIVAWFEGLLLIFFRAIYGPRKPSVYARAALLTQKRNISTRATLPHLILSKRPLRPNPREAIRREKCSLRWRQSP